MGEWHSYTEPIETLSAEDVNNISNNIIIIKELLENENYSIEELKPIFASNNTQYKDVFDILQNIEYNLDALNDNDVMSAYYGESVKIGEYASNRQDIWRWIQILNDMYEILTHERRKWTVIKCKNGFPTIEGKKIVARGDLIG